MTTPLPDHLRAWLADLRGDPRFPQLLGCCPRAALPSWTRHRPDVKAEAEWAYASGKVDGEKALLIWLLGYEPADRQSG